MPLSKIELTGIDTDRRTVTFDAFDGVKAISCAVSFEAMDDAERSKSIPAEQRQDQFARLQHRIVEAAARKHFDAKAIGNEVLVTTKDLMAVPKDIV